MFINVTTCFKSLTRNLIDFCIPQELKHQKLKINNKVHNAKSLKRYFQDRNESQFQLRNLNLLSNQKKLGFVEQCVVKKKSFKQRYVDRGSPTMCTLPNESLDHSVHHVMIRCSNHYFQEVYPTALNSYLQSYKKTIN